MKWFRKCETSSFKDRQVVVKEADQKAIFGRFLFYVHAQLRKGWAQPSSGLCSFHSLRPLPSKLGPLPLPQSGGGQALRLAMPTL